MLSVATALTLTLLGRSRRGRNAGKLSSDSILVHVVSFAMCGTDSDAYDSSGKQRESGKDCVPESFAIEGSHALVPHGVIIT